MRGWPLLAVLVLGCSSSGGVDPGSSAGGSGGQAAQAGSGGQAAGQGGSSGQGGSAGSGEASGAGGASGEGGGGQGGSADQDGPGGAGQAGASGDSGQGGGGASAGQGGGDPFGGGAGDGQGGSEAAGSAGAPAKCGLDASGPAEVFAHSGGALYRVDAITKALTPVGFFVGCGDDVIDIAIDKTGNLFGTTHSSLVRIDKTNAKCTTVKDGSYPNSLSFVPEGTVFPDKEALVGYFDSDYVVIDPTSGQVSTKGSLKGGYKSSGDIVSVIGGGTYLTIKGNECGDCIVRVDPATGDMLENLGPIGYSSVFGLAFWGGELYGFTESGKLFTYDVNTKKKTSVPIPNAPAFLSFYGAGSTTCARLSSP